MQEWDNHVQTEDHDNGITVQPIRTPSYSFGNGKTTYNGHYVFVKTIPSGPIQVIKYSNMQILYDDGQHPETRSRVWVIHGTEGTDYTELVNELGEAAVDPIVESFRWVKREKNQCPIPIHITDKLAVFVIWGKNPNTNEDLGVTNSFIVIKGMFERRHGNDWLYSQAHEYVATLQLLNKNQVLLLDTIKPRLQQREPQTSTFLTEMEFGSLSATQFQLLRLMSLNNNGTTTGEKDIMMLNQYWKEKNPWLKYKSVMSALSQMLDGKTGIFKQGGSTNTKMREILKEAVCIKYSNGAGNEMGAKTGIDGWDQDINEISTRNYQVKWGTAKPRFEDSTGFFDREAVRAVNEDSWVPCFDISISRKCPPDAGIPVMLVRRQNYVDKKILVKVGEKLLTCEVPPGNTNAYHLSWPFLLSLFEPDMCEKMESFYVFRHSEAVVAAALSWRNYYVTPGVAAAPDYVLKWETRCVWMHMPTTQQEEQMKNFGEETEIHQASGSLWNYIAPQASAFVPSSGAKVSLKLYEDIKPIRLIRAKVSEGPITDTPCLSSCLETGRGDGSPRTLSGSVEMRVGSTYLSNFLHTLEQAPFFPISGVMESKIW